MSAIGLHTSQLTYSRWERLHFKLLGHWPRRVVERRLLASDLDMMAVRAQFEHDRVAALKREYGG